MKNKTIKISSTFKDNGKRIDIFLTEKLGQLTRSNIKKIINSAVLKFKQEVKSKKYPTKKYSY